GDQVGVAATLAEAVDRPLHLDAAVLDGGHRVRDRQLGVVVAVDRERRRDPAAGGVDAGGDVRRQAAAARVAQADDARAAIGRRREAAERVLRVGGETI